MELDKRFANIDQIEKLYDSEIPGEVTANNSATIRFYPKSGHEIGYEQIYRVKLGSGGEDDITIWRIKKDLMDELSFKYCMFSSLPEYFGKHLQRYCYPKNEYISTEIRRLNSFPSNDFIKNDMERSHARLKNQPKTFTEALELIHVRFEPHQLTTEDLKKNEPIRNPIYIDNIELFDEFYQKVNYKKLLAQKIFGNVNFSDFTNFDIFCSWLGRLYFENNEYRYCICQSST